MDEYFASNPLVPSGGGWFSFMIYVLRIGYMYTVINEKMFTKKTLP